jgi:hypothetical protein
MRLRVVGLLMIIKAFIDAAIPVKKGYSHVVLYDYIIIISAGPAGPPGVATRALGLHMLGTNNKV